MTHLPLMTTKHGQVNTIKFIDKTSGSKFRVNMYAITITDIKSDELLTVWMSEPHYEAYDAKPKLFVNNLVSLLCNQCIEDETHYIDSDGDEVPHTKTYLELLEVHNMVQLTMVKNLIPEFMIDKVIADQEANVKAYKPIEKYRPGKDKLADFNVLSDKYNVATNPIYKDGIAAQLKRIGAILDPETDVWSIDFDTV